MHRYIVVKVNDCKCGSCNLENYIATETALINIAFVYVMNWHNHNARYKCHSELEVREVG
jgi:hypothetical protein